MIFISLITILTDFLQPRNQGIEQSTIQCISFVVTPRSREGVCDTPLLNLPFIRLLCLLAHVRAYAIRPFLFSVFRWDVVMDGAFNFVMYSFAYLDIAYCTVSLMLNKYLKYNMMLIFRGGVI